MELMIASLAYSSWSVRPWLAMQVAGIPFDVHQVPLLNPDATGPDNLINPDGKAQILDWWGGGTVPVLRDDGCIIGESLAILEYLADKFPDKALWPREQEARAQARAICAEMHGGFFALRAAMPMNTRRTVSNFKPPSAVSGDIQRITEIWRTMRERFGNDGDFLFGEFSNADAMYAPVCSRFRTYGVRLDDICSAYADAVLSLPQSREWYRLAQDDPTRCQYYDTV